MINKSTGVTSIKQAFEKQVAKSPDATAISYMDRRLSYRELNDCANRFAERLLQAGCVSGNIIALSTERNPNAFIAILAILKIGASYLPIDVQNPIERTLYCLRQADVKTIVSDQDCDEIREGRNVIVLSDEDEYVTQEPPRGNLGIEVGADDACYVMYTSGSTGDPKGVLIPNRGVLRLVQNTNYIDIKPTDNILQFAPLSFDASTFEIWGALLNGGTLVLYPGDGLDPNVLARTIENNNVTVLWLTAALFHIIASRYLDALKTVTTLVAGGDVLFPDLVNAVFDRYPEVTVINGYGPTENTTFTCCHVMTISNRPGDYVPIGKAINGTRLHLLNDQSDAISTSGDAELFVSGAGVALGYVGKDESAQFFYDNSIATGLIYATGDLVRKNENGDLEFRGRIDNQVKIRGYRVSLEEIQGCLLKLDDVIEAFVVLNDLGPGEQQLVAFLKIASGRHLSSAYVRSLLAEDLPKYMIPNTFHFDKEFPICKNGKIDRTHPSISAVSI